LRTLRGIFVSGMPSLKRQAVAVGANAAATFVCDNLDRAQKKMAPKNSEPFSQTR
jgi:hypothetical protein